MRHCKPLSKPAILTVPECGRIPLRGDPITGDHYQVLNDYIEWRR